MTNKEFATNEEFKKACEEAGITTHTYVIKKHKSTSPKSMQNNLTRQASKYRNNKGIVYKTKKGL
jgi:mRNA-degrading endonuclease HigB of HigAB toxin-antitoxin module